MSEPDLADVQSERDDRSVAIEKVGIRGLSLPIRLIDREEPVQNSVATVALHVDLPPEVRGTHMSRFVEVINDHGPDIGILHLGGILRSLQERLDARNAYLEIESPFFLDKNAPVSGLPGTMCYRARFLAERKGEESRVALEVEVPVKTLCPCSKAISRHGAHNQRGRVRVRVRFSRPVWIRCLIDLVESSASSSLYTLLKRSDEKHVTERAYESPVFVEDLVRNVALRLDRDPRITWYQVEAENEESIHNHNVYALVRHP